jgi:DNA-binding beta-propeller fold protein YncE
VDRLEFLATAAGAPLGLARASGGTPVALVTADLESHLAVCELGSARVVRRIETLPGPRSAQAVATAAVVAHTAHGALSVVDGPSLRVRTVVRGLAEPRYTAPARDGRHAYVTDSKRGEVVLVDVIRGRVVHRTAVGGPARHASGSGRLLWTALGSKAKEIAVLDVGELRPRLLGTLRPPFLAHDVGFAPDGRVWVTSGDRGAIGVYDAASGRLVFRLRADAPPQHVAFLGALAFVTSGDDGSLRVHSLRDGRLVRTTRVPVGSYNVQDGWGLVVSPSLERGTLCIAGRDGRLLAGRRVARSSHDACTLVAA